MRRLTDFLGMVGGVPVATSLIVTALVVALGISFSSPVGSLARIVVAVGLIVGTFVGVVLVPSIVIRDVRGLYDAWMRWRREEPVFVERSSVEAGGDVLARLSQWGVLASPVFSTQFWIPLYTRIQGSNVQNRPGKIPPLGPVLGLAVLAIVVMIQSAAGRFVRQREPFD